MDGELTLTRGGRLLEERWDEGTREYVWVDVTDVAFRKLWTPCAVAEGVTLGDILSLVERHIGVLEPVIGNWCREILEECLRGAPPSWNPSEERERDGKDALERLVLRWYTAVSRGHRPGPTIDGLLFPSLSGEGQVHADDYVDGEGTLMCPAGERLSYGVEFVPSYKLAHLPVVLDARLTINREWTAPNGRIETDGEPGGISGYPQGVGLLPPSLGQILYGIFWELSYAGPPAERDRFASGMRETLADLRDGGAVAAPCVDRDEHGI